MNTAERITRGVFITYTEYDNFRESRFHVWCARYAALNRISLQMMVKSDMLRNWYYMQWNEYVELPFVKNYEEYFGNEEMSSTLLDIIFEMPSHIETIYPDILIKEIINESKSINSRRNKVQQSRV